MSARARAVGARREAMLKAAPVVVGLVVSKEPKSREAALLLRDRVVAALGRVPPDLEELVSRVDAPANYAASKLKEGRILPSAHDFVDRQQDAMIEMLRKKVAAQAKKVGPALVAMADKLAKHGMADGARFSLDGGETWETFKKPKPKKKKQAMLKVIPTGAVTWPQYKEAERLETAINNAIDDAGLVLAKKPKPKATRPTKKAALALEMTKLGLPGQAVAVLRHGAPIVITGLGEPKKPKKKKRQTTRTTQRK